MHWLVRNETGGKQTAMAPAAYAGNYFYQPWHAQDGGGRLKVEQGLGGTERKNCKGVPEPLFIESPLSLGVR